MTSPAAARAGGRRAHAEFLQVWEEGYVADPIAFEAMHTRVILVVDGDGLRRDDGRLDRDRIVERLRLASDTIDVFRLRLLRSPLGLTPPAWVPDDRFDLNRHISFAPERSALGRESFDTLTGVGEGTMPLRHPLWRVRITELDGGDIAVAITLHHVSADGLGAMKIITALTDGSADAAPRRRTTALPPDARAPRSRLALPVIALRAWAATQPNASAAWDAYWAKPFRRRVRRVAARLARPMRAIRANRAANRAHGLPRRHSTFADVDALSSTRRASDFGGTVGDLLTAAVIRAAGDRDGDARVRVRVPLSERTGLDDLARNRVRDIEVIGSSDDDLGDLTRAVRAQVDARRAMPSTSGAGRQIGYVTVVPWRSRPRYFAGSQVRRLLPFPAGMPRDELSVGGLLYDGRITIAATMSETSDVDAAVDAIARDLTGD